MRILLATHHLVTLGGTEMWTRVMFDLSREHEVDVYSVVSNTLWPEMPTFDPTTHYDLALINHNRTMLALRRARIHSRIMVLHGIRPSLEWPVLGADAYVSVAEDVRQFVPVPSVVIGNPIEIHRFKPRRPLSEQLRRVAFLSNYESPASKTPCRSLRTRRTGPTHGGPSEH